VTQLLATRLGAVKPSASIAARARVEALRAAGRRIVDFTLGEPDFPTPSHIIMGGMKALLDGHTRYTASAGTPALRKAIAAKLARENALEFGRDQIVVGCGAKHIIFAALEATLNPDDEVIIPAPYWVSYPDMVALQGAVPVIVYSRAELQAICAVLRAHPQVWLLTDEIYEHFTYSGVSHASPLNVAPELASRTLIINGMSKAYAMTGWRVGYGAGPQPLIKAITLLLTQSTTCATASSQAAAVVALEGSQDCVRDAVQLFAKRRDCMIDLLNRIPGVHCTRPDGAFYVFPSVEGLVGQKTAAGKTLANDVDVMMYLLDEAGVATIDGTSYGMPGHLRLSFATSIEEIEAGCAGIASAVAACGGTSGPILSNTEQSTDV
jgi:aspartate aminotransferase